MKNRLPFLLPSVLVAMCFGAGPLSLFSAPVEVPTLQGKAVSPTAELHKIYYDEWHFAPVRVEGDWVYAAGVAAVAGEREDEMGVLDVAKLENLFRRAWRDLQMHLEAAGSSTGCIVEMTTFHVFKSPHFRGTKWDHINAFRRVKDEFVPAPYPAWTGIGVESLFPDGGMVEIRVVARLKPPAARPAQQAAPASE